MISQATFMGGCDEVDLDANKSLTSAAKRVQIVTPDLDQRVLSLPDARLLDVGGPIYYIINKNGIAANIDVKDFDGNLLVNDTPANKGTIFSLADNTTSAGIWSFVRMDA